MSQPPVPATLPPRSSNTPALFSLARIVTTLTIILFTVASTLSISNARTAVDDAHRATEQYMRLSKVGSDLTLGHAFEMLDLATSPSLTPSFQQWLSKAHKGITEAAVAEPGDRDKLLRLQDKLTEYELIVANIVASPAPADKAREADGFLTGQVLPLLHEISADNASRVEAAKAEQSQIWIWVSAAGVILALALTSWFLAVRTHRILNLGVLISLVALVAGLMLGNNVVSTTAKEINGAVSSTIPRSASAASATEESNLAAALTGIISLSKEPAGGPLHGQRQSHLDKAKSAVDTVNFPDVTAAFGAFTADPSKANHVALWTQLGTVPSAIDADYREGQNGATTRALWYGIGNILMAFVSIAALNWGVGRRLGEYR